MYLQCGYSDVFSGCGDYQRKHRRTDMECGICRTRRGCFGTENGGNAFNPAAIRHFYRDIYPVSGHFDRYLRFKIYTGRIKYPVNFHCGCSGNTQPAGCGEARHFTGGTYHRGNDCRESDCVYHDEI